MLSKRRFLTVAFAVAVATLSAGCQPFVVPPQLSPELRYVVDNPTEFGATNPEAARVVAGTEIDASELTGCWGASVAVDFDLGEAGSGENTESANAELGAFGIPLIVPVREAAVYVFDADGGTMKWHMFTSDGFGFFPFALSWEGRFELFEGNMLRLDVESISASDPNDGSIVSTPVDEVLESDEEPKLEWLIAVRGDVLQFEAVGSLTEPNSYVIRDGVPFQRFACP